MQKVSMVLWQRLIVVVREGLLQGKVFKMRPKANQVKSQERSFPDSKGAEMGKSRGSSQHSLKPSMTGVYSKGKKGKGRQKPYHTSLCNHDNILEDVLSLWEAVEGFEVGEWHKLAYILKKCIIERTDKRGARVGTVGQLCGGIDENR